MGPVYQGLGFSGVSILRGQDLSGVTFVRAHLFQGSHFSGVTICRGHIFQGPSFSGVMFSGVRLSGVKFLWGQVWLVSNLVVQDLNDASMTYDPRTCFSFFLSFSLIRLLLNLTN